MNHDSNSKGQHSAGHPEAEERLIRAAGLFRDGKVKSAKEAFLTIAADYPDFFPAQAACGDLLLTLGKPAAALGPLRRAVRIALHEGIGHYLLGVAYLKTARFHHALRSLQAAKALLSENGDVLAHLGRARLMVGDLAGARELISQAIREDVSNAFFHMDMAQTYAQVKEFDPALRWLESAKALAPAEPFVLENLRLVRELKREFDAMPAAKQATLRELTKDPAYHQEMRIELLTVALSEGPGSAEDLAEIKEELRQAGLIGQIAMFRNPASPQARQAKAYIAIHRNVPKPEPGAALRPEEFERLEATLADPRARKREKGQALIGLAQQGTDAALRALARYRERPDAGLETWAAMACDECRSLLEARAQDLPPVTLHVLDADRS